jgi:hypothetical protein
MALRKRSINGDRTQKTSRRLNGVSDGSTAQSRDHSDSECERHDDPYESE